MRRPIRGQLQQFMSVVDFGLSPAEAHARPRFVRTAFPYDANNVLDVELPGKASTDKRPV